MKFILLILGTLGTLISIASATPLDLTVTSIHPEGELHKYNEWRSKLAANQSIPNMNELTWDDSLVERAKKMSNQCDHIVHGEDYRFFLANPDAVSQIGQGVEMLQLALVIQEMQKLDEDLKEIAELKFEKELEKYLKKHKDDPKLSFGFMEALLPYQTKIGCADHKCTGKFPDNEAQGQLSGLDYSYAALCLVGLRKVIEDVDYPKGAPGSSCPNGKTPSGLCKAQGPPTFAPGPSPLEPSHPLPPSEPLVQQPEQPVQPLPSSSTCFLGSTSLYLLVITAIVFFF